jgi:hypothetical protein
VIAARMNSVSANQSAKGRAKYKNITATPGAASRRKTVRILGKDHLMRQVVA